MATMKKILMVLGGQYHPLDRCGEIVKKLLEDTGRYLVTPTHDLNTLRAGNIGRFDAAIVYADGGELRKDQENGLVNFVKNGGAFIGLHGAAASFTKNAAYVDMLGSTFAGHDAQFEFPVTPTAADSMITRRIQPFRVTDELYLLDKFQADSCEVLATAMWRGKPQPMAYTRTHGKGRVFFLALGHDERSLNHPEVQEMIRRGVDWTFGRKEIKSMKAGVIGYGKSFKMGRLHLESMRAAGFEIVAACDLVEQRRIEAEEDFPGIPTYASSRKMLEKSGVELATVITEHNDHAKRVIECLNAGVHAITEKPFCITIEEADAMIAAARRNRRMLSVFHNRRWDGDYMAIKHAIASGLIGEVFHIEACMGGYGHPSYWWRSEKKISGGAFYDWGAHVVDWTLGLVPAQIVEVSGYFQEKRVWHDVTNEDHCSATVRFSNGCSAFIELSQIAAAGKPRWRILGTKGGILDYDDDKFTVISYRDGVRSEATLKYFESDWHAYYRNIADHLMLGEPLVVTPESARRVIAVIATAEKSSKAGKALPMPKHCA